MWDLGSMSSARCPKMLLGVYGSPKPDRATRGARAAGRIGGIMSKREEHERNYVEVAKVALGLEPALF